jgi:thiol-disulfide isomerase/thioredoxin
LRIGGVGSVLALALAACGQGPVSGPADGGQAAPPAATAAADAPRVGIDRSHAPEGDAETLADIVAAHGGPVLVNLWATWCTPCIKELPTLDRLQAEAGPALKVLPISQDMEGWRVVTAAFTPERYPHLATRLDSQMAFGAALGLRGLPVTILYDANAREVWRYHGDEDWAGAGARALIAEASAPAAR